MQDRTSAKVFWSHHQIIRWKKREKERSTRGIIYGRAEWAIKVSLMPPSAPAPTSWLLGPEANLQNSAGWPAPAALGVGALSVLISQSFPGAASPKAIGQSCLSIAGRQPSRGLRQHIPAPAPASPALLPRFNFMFIRSTEKDIFSRSKGHSEHERNTVTGQELVMWYPHWKTSCFPGPLGGWERMWPGTISGKCRNLHSGSVQSGAWRVGSAEKNLPWEHSVHQPHNPPAPSSLLPLPQCDMPPRMKRGLKPCPSSVPGGGSQYSWKDETIKISE